MDSSPNACSLVLVRHGRVEETWTRRLYGGLDVPLSEQGLDDSRRAAERLSEEPLAAVVSSGLERAEALAALLRAGRGLPRRDETGLVEIHRGDWAGLGESEIEAIERGAWARFQRSEGREAPPNGESLEALQRRVVAVLDRLAAEHPATSVAVVAHKWVLRTAVCAALGLDLGHSTRIEVPPAGAAWLDWPCVGLRDGLARLVGLGPLGGPAVDPAERDRPRVAP